MVFMRLEVSVVTLAAAATVEFFSSAMSVLPSGAIEPRNAWGRMMSRAAGRNDSPMARAASAWPIGTVFTPDRIDSHTNAAW
ncbi:MAG: hypothetical protein K0S43_844 [Cellulosimicrobium sp.]|nr:hypothetical protein [Cellulosimicrobium sp.]